MRRCIVFTTNSVLAATVASPTVSLTNHRWYYHKSEVNNGNNTVYYKRKGKFDNARNGHSKRFSNQFVAEEQQELEEVGWRYETVDSTTGQTELEKVYDNQLKSIHNILASPLPHLPPDGNVQPDFFVGFAYYSYTSRDLYRSLIANALSLPVNAIKLSVSWSGRFAVKHFNRVQKVCGVLVDREILQQTQYAADENRHSKQKSEIVNGNSDINCKKGSTEDSSKDRTKEEMKSRDKLEELPPSLLAKIDALIGHVNKRNDERWLKYHLVQASHPIPEVEFALHNTEHQLMQNVFDWIKRVSLQRHVVVVVYGSCANLINHQNEINRSDSECSNESEKKEIISADQLQKIVLDCVSDMQSQFTWIQSKWLKIFYKRKVIPQVISINELASMLMEQVLCKANVAPIKSQGDQNSLQEEASLESVQSEDINNEKGVSNTNISYSNVKAISNVNEIWELFSLSEQASLTRFVNTVLKLGKDGSGLANKERKINTNKLLSYNNILCVLDVINAQEQQESSVPHNESKRVQLCDVMCVMKLLQEIKRALLMHEYRAHNLSVYNYKSNSVNNSSNGNGWNRDGLLPALFLHGAYAGGRDEMRYLQANKVACDAIILHPNDVAMKNKFAARLEQGRTRLRVYEEVNAMTHETSEFFLET